jgi:hypothetical protein
MEIEWKVLFGCLLFENRQVVCTFSTGLQFGDAASRRRLQVERSDRALLVQDDDTSRAHRIQLDFLAITKEAMAALEASARERSQNDVNWLQYGLAAITFFLLGCTVLSDRKSLAFKLSTWTLLLIGMYCSFRSQESCL